MAKPIRTRGVDVLEAHNRFKEGEKVSEDEWDRKIIPKTAKKYVEKYDIEMNPSKPIPENEALKDDLFEAGIEMLSEIGIFNLDREKVMEVKEEEIKTGLEKAPKRLTLGSGNNAAKLRQRTRNPDTPPLTQGGPTGAPVSEELMVEMHQIYAQEPSVDTIVDGVPSSYLHQETPAGTPWEIAGTLFELRSVREACARADRPNMGIQGPETPLTEAGRLAADLYGGLRPCDSHECSQLNEIKIDDAGLNMVAGWAKNGDIIMIEQMPIFGGYAGGLEESTLCDMCAHLISFTTLNCSWHLDGPIHVRWGITTSRETLTMAGHVAASLDKHTDLLLGNQYYPLSGPCTEMCLKEVAAQAITDTVSGREIMSGSASAKGVLENYTTGLESKMMSKAAEAIAGESVSKANKILDDLVNEYEKKYKEAETTKDPSNTELGRGKKLTECYDMKTLTPTDEYFKVYDSVLEDLEDLGLSF